MKTINNLSFFRFLAFALFFGVNMTFAQIIFAANVSGEAWSSNIGWIRFAGIAQNGSSYGANIAENGEMSGYAWSEHIGAISFEPASLVGCPAAPCAAKVNPVAVAGKNYISGWARACSVFQSGCSGALKGSSELGGWDGWIKLNGMANGSPYGWYIDASGDFHGYIYGASDSGDANTGIIGWVSANCLEGSASGGSVCGQSNYKLHTTASFGPIAAMSCDPAATASNCEGGICDNAPGAKWMVYIPNVPCPNCRFTAKNDSTGTIVQQTWELVGTTYSSTSNTKSDYTFPVLDLVSGDYELRLTVSDGISSPSTASRIVTIRRDILNKPLCSFDNPVANPLTNYVPPSPMTWMDCGSNDFKRRVTEGERIYVHDASTGSDGGSGLTAISDRLWTLVGSEGSASTASQDASFLAGKNNKITLWVKDSNPLVRTCTVNTEFNGMTLPEWQEIGPVGVILNFLTAKISEIFKTL